MQKWVKFIFEKCYDVTVYAETYRLSNCYIDCIIYSQYSLSDNKEVHTYNVELNFLHAGEWHTLIDVIDHKSKPEEYEYIKSHLPKTNIYNDDLYLPRYIHPLNDDVLESIAGHTLEELQYII